MAAWRLAESGHQVTVLEQYELDHDRGSSYGDSRIVRRVYPDAFYTSLMASAYPLWAELQSRFPREELFTATGGIFVGPRDHPAIRDAEAALRHSKATYEMLSAAMCHDRFPAFRLQQNEVALFDPSMGYARASRCVRAAAQLAQNCGTNFRFQTTVENITTRSNQIEIGVHEGESVLVDRLIICAGPWAQPLLASLGVPIPLTVTRKTYIHLLPAQHEENFEAGRFPVWIDAASLAYGFPRLGDVPGIKIAIHDRGEATTPDTVERMLHDVDRERLRTAAHTRFPDIGDEIVYEKVCLYTNTPDADFIVDRVPGLPGAFLIGGLSGHGFKFGPLLGEIGASLVTDKAVPYNLSRFALSRF
jgi:monomeric sarcosine oxidase